MQNKKSSPLKKILLLILVIAVFVGLAFGFYLLFIGISYMFTVPGIASLILFFLFTLIVFWFRLHWDRAGTFILGAMAFLGTILDILGNSIYNKPLEWLYGNQFISNTSTVSYGGETIMNVAFKIVNEKGEVLSTIPYLGVAAFRAIEYVLIYAILLSLYGGITKRLERKL